MTDQPLPAEPATIEEFHILLGRITTAFAMLDFLTSLILEGLRGTKEGPPPGLALGRKIGHLLDVKPQNTRHPEVLAVLDGHLQEAQAVVKLRNSYLHDNLVFSDEFLQRGRLGVVRLHKEDTEEGPFGKLRITFPDPVSREDMERLIGRIVAVKEVFAQAAFLLGWRATPDS